MINQLFVQPLPFFPFLNTFPSPFKYIMAMENFHSYHWSYYLLDSNLMMNNFYVEVNSKVCAHQQQMGKCLPLLLPCLDRSWAQVAWASPGTRFLARVHVSHFEQLSCVLDLYNELKKNYIWWICLISKKNMIAFKEGEDALCRVPKAASSTIVLNWFSLNTNAVSSMWFP